MNKESTEQAAREFMLSKLELPIQHETLYHEYYEWMADFARQQLQAERVKIAQDLLWVRAGATNFVQLSEDLGKFADRLRGEGE